MFVIFILSVVQGITEFLPISSSSHLILVSNYLNYSNTNLSTDVSLHIGSFFAVLFYFKKDILSFVRNKNLFLKIFISSIPIMIIGYILVEYRLIEQLRNIKTIGWATLIFGILLYFSDNFERDKKIENNFTYRSAIFIGLFQVLSLIPGASRSGISITAARFLNFDRVDAAKISFLLSIPTLAAVSVFGINNLIKTDDLQFSLINIFSILLSFVFSLVTIKFFLRFIRNFSLKIFVIYRVFLGIIILCFAYL